MYEELDKYIPYYPYQSDPLLQYDISRMLEFYELEGSKDENKPTINGFFRHQELALRFIKQYDRMFVIHETGTGKSALLILISEYFRNNDESIKHTFVLEPGKFTSENFKEEIIKHINIEDKYEKKLKSLLDDKDRKNIHSRIVNKWYDVVGYQKFSKIIDKMNDNEIIEEFSDSLFFLDEVHRLRNIIEEENDENIYKNIWKVLHLAKRCKIIIATATPLVNNVDDFVPLANLLLEANSQLPQTINYNLVSSKQLYDYLGGIITYVRSLDLNINIKYEGEILSENPYEIEVGDNNTFKLIEDKKFKKKKINIKSESYIYKLEMDEYQANIYKKFFNSDENNAVFIKEEQISNGVFFKVKNKYNQYNKEYGDLASNFVYTIIKKKNYKYAQFTPEYKKIFENKNQKDILNLIKQLSIKYHFICENELKEFGKAFVYNRLNNTSGNYYLGLFLELLGYKPYFGGNIIYDNNTKTFNVSEYFNKEKRYALLIGGTNYEQIMGLYNSKDNINGDYLKIIIGSNVSQEGITLNNTLRCYIALPEWHESGTYQAISRIIRTGAYNYLKEQNENVEVKIYKLAATIKGIETVDIKKYKRSEEKDIKNKLLLRKFKEIAFDGYINYRRNVRESDKNFTKDADYSEALYKLITSNYQPSIKDKKYYAYNQINLNKEGFINENVKIFYSDNIIKREKEKIKKILIQNGSLTINNLEIILGKSLNYYQYIALYDLINTNNFILDNYGYKRYFKLKGNSIYITNDNNYNKELNRPPSIYKYNIFTTINDNPKQSYEDIFDKIINEIDDLNLKFKNYKNKFDNFMINNYDVINIVKKYTNFSQNKLFELLEYVMIKKYLPILNLFNIYIIKCEIEEDYFDCAQYILYEKIMTGKGRKINFGDPNRLKKAFLEYDNITPKKKNKRKFVFHFFPYVAENTKSYGFIDNFYRDDRNIRIFKNNQFFDSEKDEKSILNWYLNRKILEPLFKNYNKTGIWSSFSIHEDKFRIHNFEPNNKGIDCKTINYPKLKNILFKLNIENNHRKREMICEDILIKLKNEDKILLLM